MDVDIKFKDYLVSKKIDSAKFKTAEPKLFEELDCIFMQMNPDSFTAQKLFLINPLRRKYQLEVDEKAVPVKPKKMFKPKLK